MDIAHLQDRFNWGLNRAANILGSTTDAYRPNGESDPLSRSNRFLCLRAAFSRADGNFSQPVGYGTALYRGFYDASYTRVGDYLVQENATWFVVQQQSMLPVLCARANRVISIYRQSTPVTGVSEETILLTAMTNVICRWPASVLGIGTEGKSTVELPSDTKIPGWTVLLPALHNLALRPDDILIDENGTRGVVIAVELSDLGWRLNVRQITT